MATELNQTTLKAMSDMSQDGCMLQGIDVTVPVTTAFVVVDDYEEAVSGGLSVAVAGTGIITAGRTGKAMILVSGSFESISAGTGTFKGHIFVNGVDTGYGFERSISVQASVGSFTGMCACDVVSGNAVELRVLHAGSGDMLFHQLNLALVWID